MAGCILWRCGICRESRTTRFCNHAHACYHIKYQVGKHQRWQAVGRRKKDAERRLAEIHGELHGGVYRDLKSSTLAAFALQWLQIYGEPSLKPSTLRRYRGLVRTHLEPAFGDLPLTAIRPEAIERFKARTLKEGLAPRTVNQALAVLKIMLRYARQWGYLRQNPAQEVKPVRVDAVEMDYLKPEEVRLLLKHADEPYRTLFLTAVMTGMRQSELLALQWGDISWEAHLIRVRRSLFWYTRRELTAANGDQTVRWRFIEPKSKRSVRSVVMSPVLSDALERHRLRPPVSPQDLVFCTSDGSPIDPWHLVRREFCPALAMAGLRRVRFHDLRHTYTALMIAQGAHVKFIQSQLGHASIQTTLDRYGHLLPEVQYGVGGRLDTAVFGSRPPTGSLTAVQHGW